MGHSFVILNSAKSNKYICIERGHNKKAAVLGLANCVCVSVCTYNSNISPEKQMNTEILEKVFYVHSVDIFNLLKLDKKKINRHLPNA